MKLKEIFGTFVGTIIEVVLVVIVVMLIARAGMTAYNFGYGIFADKTVDEEPGRDLQVTTTKDQTNKDIAAMLEEKGLIPDANIFYVRLMLTDYRKLLKPGTYTLNTSMKPEVMMAILSGEEIEEEE